jgi:hypothetical protein
MGATSVSKTGGTVGLERSAVQALASGTSDATASARRTSVLRALVRAAPQVGITCSFPRYGRARLASGWPESAMYES